MVSEGKQVCAAPRHACSPAFPICCRVANHHSLGLRNCRHAGKEVQHVESHQRFCVGIVLGGGYLSDRGPSAHQLINHSFTRVSVAIQFTSHVLPPSSENACSKWQEFGVISEMTNRTRIARPFKVSWS